MVSNIKSAILPKLKQVRYESLTLTVFDNVIILGFFIAFFLSSSEI